MSALVCGAQDAAEGFGELREEGMDEVGDDEADGVGASAGQAARHHVGLVVQLLHALQHALAGLFADVAVAAQHLGDGDGGDAEIARDVFQPDRHTKLRLDDAIRSFCNRTQDGELGEARSPPQAPSRRRRGWQQQDDAEDGDPAEVHGQRRHDGVDAQPDEDAGGGEDDGVVPPAAALVAVAELVAGLGGEGAGRSRGRSGRTRAATASLVEVCSWSEATAVLMASAPRIMTAEPAMTSSMCGRSAVASSPKTSAPQARPQSWLVLESGMPRPMPRYLVANCWKRSPMTQTKPPRKSQKSDSGVLEELEGGGMGAAVEGEGEQQNWCPARRR